MELIDNNNDELTDVVIIWSYEVNKVVFADENSGKIYLRGEMFEIGIMDTFSIFRNGTNKPLSITELGEGDVVLIAKSDDGQAVRIEKIINVITGTVNGKDDEDIIIDNNRYSVAEKCMTDKNVNDGDTAEFYLDNSGNIVAITEVSTAMKYGYLINSSYKDAAGAELEVKIFDQKGIMQILKVAQKIKLNSESGKNQEDFINALKSDTDVIQPQVIMFSLNTKGEIKTVDTAYNFSVAGNYKNIEPPPAEDAESFRLIYSKSDSALKFESTLGSFGGKYSVYRSVVFTVPSDVKSADDDDFTVTPGQGTSGAVAANVDVYVADSKTFMPHVFVLYDLSSGLSNTEEYGCLVSEMETFWGEKEEVVQKLKLTGPPGVEAVVYNRDNEIDLDTIPGFKNASVKSKVDKGDFIYAKWQGDKLVSAEMVYDMETDNIYPNNTPFGGDQHFEFGAVYEYTDGVIRIMSLSDLEKIKEHQAEIDMLNNAEMINELENKIKTIEEKCVVYYALSLKRKANVKTNARGKVKVVPGGAENAYIAYKDSNENYSKVLIYTKLSSPWMIVEYAN